MYTCACEPGYYGQSCETNVNECNTHPCVNGGSCIVSSPATQIKRTRNYLSLSISAGRCEWVHVQMY